MRARIAATSIAALVLVGALAGCTQTIAGTPGPRPTLSGSGDFPTGDPTTDPTSDPTSSPTDGPTPTDTSTDVPTDVPTGGDAGSVDFLCERLDYGVQQGDTVSPDTLKTYTRLIIYAWGIANSDDDPYSKVDAATTSGCPDTRSALLDLLSLPDLKSTEN